MLFVSGVVHFECFHKLITTHPKATFGAGLAESGSTSTAVSLAGISLPNILAAWSISVMCSHLERCEVAVGRKQGLHAGLTAPLEKAFSKLYGGSQRHWWQSSQYLLLSQSCTCLCKTRPVSKDYQRIFLIDCRESFSGVQFALGSFLCPKPVTSLWSSEHLFGQTNPPWVIQQSCETLSPVQATSCCLSVCKFWLSLCDSWTSVFQKPRIRMNSWRFSTRRWSCCRLHTVKHYGISWHIWRGGWNSCKEL